MTLVTHSPYQTCEEVIKNPRYFVKKSRYQRASLTVEASLVFPMFFFAVFCFLQLFCVLQAELSIAKAGIQAAREAAAVSYVTERFSNGESIAAKTLQKVFDQKILKDVTATAFFYSLCDEKLLKRAGVAKGISGLSVDTGGSADVKEWRVSYQVDKDYVLFPMSGKTYSQSFRYRNFTGTGKKEEQVTTEDASEKNDEVVYLATNASVYHRYPDCSFIQIQPRAVSANQISGLRNSSNQKYSSCEYCKPDLSALRSVYVTEQGRRYHASSTCSAIRRKPVEKKLSELNGKLEICKKCKKRLKSENKE